jgi:hypothetical protein
MDDLDRLIEEVMQSGFDVAMGGTPFEPYDNERAFEKARAANRTKLNAWHNTQLYTEVLELIGEDEPVMSPQGSDIESLKRYQAEYGGNSTRNQLRATLRAKAKAKWGKA